MTNILPEFAGLEVNGLVYQYTTVKDPESDMIVYVQNEYVDREGYIFRSADDWSGLPGNTINRSFAVPNSLGSLWGNGSIQVDGEGSILDPSVIYTYKYDTCFDPQADPSCPGYEEIVEVPEIPFTDPLEDQLVLDELNRQAKIDREEEEEDRRRRQRESKIKDALPTSYYNPLEGGDYVETVVLDGGTIQDNQKARRANFAQQVLHQEMVDSQYESGASAQQEK